MGVQKHTVGKTPKSKDDGSCGKLGQSEKQWHLSPLLEPVTPSHGVPREKEMHDGGSKAIDYPHYILKVGKTCRDGSGGGLGVL